MNPLLYFVDWIKIVALTIATNVTPIFQPYEDFTREADIIQNISLQQKADIFEADLVKNHLTVEGVFLYEKPVNLGDMAIWNGVHVAYRAIRYGATHDPVDLELLKKYMKTIQLMQTHPETGETMMLRARIPLFQYDGSHGGFRHVHQNDQYVWQEDASGDSFAGHVYGMAMAYKYGDQEVKDYIAYQAKNLYYSMKAYKWRFHNADGTITKFSPEPPGVTSAPMSISTALLLRKILELAYPDDPELGVAYTDWAIRKNQIHVVSHNMAFFLWKMKYSGINQAKMALHGLCELETNEKYRKKYIKSYRRGWKTLDEDGDTYLTFLIYRYYPKAVKERQLEKAIQVLHEFSTNHKVAINVDLIDDPDIRKVNWDGKKAVQPYPVWRQPAQDYLWQRDTHKVDGNHGCFSNCRKYSGLDFLIAYYLGREFSIYER